MPLKTVALISAVSVTIGWLLAATLSPPVARLQSLPEPQRRSAAVDDPARLTEQLNLRLRTRAEPPISRRNLFAFGDRRAPQPEALVPEAPLAEGQPLTPAPVGPAYTLAGIGISGEVRTAVLSDGVSVHIVKVTDSIGGYTVAEITDDSVTLVSDSGARHLLRFNVQ